MSNPVILLDCDGVLSDFIGPVCALASSVTGRTHAPADVTRFDFASCLELTPLEKRQVTDYISMSTGWWSQLPILPGAREGVARLQDLGDVYIVTSPWNSCATWLHEREAWLKRHFNIPHSRVLAGSAKHLVSGDIFVDDKTETLVNWCERQSSGIAVQWITPHNRLDGWKGHSTNNWARLAEIVRVHLGVKRIDAGLRELRDNAPTTTDRSFKDALIAGSK